LDPGIISHEITRQDVFHILGIHAVFLLFLQLFSLILVLCLEVVVLRFERVELCNGLFKLNFKFVLLLPSILLVLYQLVACGLPLGLLNS